MSRGTGCRGVRETVHERSTFHLVFERSKKCYCTEKVGEGCWGGGQQCVYTLGGMRVYILKNHDCSVMLTETTATALIRQVD